MRACKRCGKEKPLEGGFRKNGVSKAGTLLYRHECVECERERAREYGRELRKDPAYREYQRKYMRERYRELRKDPAYREQERERQRELRKHPAYRGRKNARDREYSRGRRKDPAYREMERKRMKEYNRERKKDPAYREMERKRHEKRWKNDPAFRERKKKNGKEWGKTTKGKFLIRAYNTNRRAIRNAGDDGTMTHAYLEVLLSASVCPYCWGGMATNSKNIDHLDPLKPQAGEPGGTHSVYNVIACCSRCNSRKKNRPFTEWLGMLPEDRRDHVRRLYENVKALGDAWGKNDLS